VNGRADGFTLLEALAALTLTALFASALVATSVAQMRLTRAMTMRAASLDAVRTVAWVLGGEVRRGNVRDVRAVAGDSMALRNFRGRGIPCNGSGDGITVRYLGDRLPNPDKDSLLLIGPWGEAVAKLVGVHDDAGCASGVRERVLRLEATMGHSPPALVLIFESGTYYLSSSALRYRSGAEGRQPITAELLAGSRFLGFDPRAVRFTLTIDGLASVEQAAFFPPYPYQP
jgi:hypothetical protein